MPPTARGALGAVAPEAGLGTAEGACDGEIDGDCEGVTDGDCDGVTAGVSEGVTPDGVRPDWGCAMATLASASNVAEATDLTVIASSVKRMAVSPYSQAACHGV